MKAISSDDPHLPLSFQYPNNWHVRQPPIPGQVVFFLSIEPHPKYYFVPYISVTARPATHSTLEDLATAWMTSRSKLPAFNFLSRRDTELGHCKAVQLDATYKAPRLLASKAGPITACERAILALRGDTEYEVYGRAHDEDFDEVAPALDIITASLSLQ